ncbi:MAG: GTPase ObgE [Synergistaceae bacterium]
MKFVDSLRVSAKAGRGGNGCMSFLREKFKPNGGPDGGNGGRGGSIIFEATTNIQTLADLEHLRIIKGVNGVHGKGRQKNGAAGTDTVIFVPCGTLFYDAETNLGLADLVEPGDRFFAAMGGRGGRGNKHFASSRRKAPRFCEKGDLGEEVELRLELHLIADIGLVGLPNVGKSSILAAISNAEPKIADYPFTTLSPNLGVLNTGFERIVIADIPGLIEGAHLNKGLGLEFLRHIERTRLLIHVLSLEHNDFNQHIADFEIIRHEMKSYDNQLKERPYIVVGNKIDVLDDTNEVIKALEKHFKKNNIKFYPISALTGEGVVDLVKQIIEFSKSNPRPHSEVRLFAVEEKIDNTLKRQKNKIEVIKLHGGGFQVIHRQLEKAAERYDLTQDENLGRFIILLRKYKVEQLLEAAGAQAGDTVTIGYSDFNFYPDYFPPDMDEDNQETDSNENTSE